MPRGAGSGFSCCKRRQREVLLAPHPPTCTAHTPFLCQCCVCSDRTCLTQTHMCCSAVQAHESRGVQGDQGELRAADEDQGWGQGLQPPGGVGRRRPVLGGAPRRAGTVILFVFWLQLATSFTVLFGILQIRCWCAPAGTLATACAAIAVSDAPLLKAAAPLRACTV